MPHPFNNAGLFLDFLFSHFLAWTHFLSYGKHGLFNLFCGRPACLRRCSGALACMEGDVYHKAGGACRSATKYTSLLFRICQEARSPLRSGKAEVGACEDLIQNLKSKIAKSRRSKRARDARQHDGGVPQQPHGARAPDRVPLRFLWNSRAQPRLRRLIRRDGLCRDATNQGYE